MAYLIHRIQYGKYVEERKHEIFCANMRNRVKISRTHREKKILRIFDIIGYAYVERDGADGAGVDA